jgi:methionine-rich copper-binding protein CopC
VDGLVSVQIPPLQPDKYEVSWRVLSVDGHPVAGRFTFTIEAPNAQ